MKIKVADKIGFCHGVRRALTLGQEAARQEGAVTLGPLVHNSHVVEELTKLGLEPVNELGEAQGRPLLIRAHGTTAAVLDEAKALGLPIMDATCPFVKRAQAAGRQLAQEVNMVLILGDSGHPEVEGLVDAAGQAHVIARVEELENVIITGPVGVIAQTTQPKAIFAELLAKLEERGIDYRAVDTICQETEQRQAAMRRLAGESDVVIVVGGKHSANTRQLATIARECGRRSYLIESACELEPEWIAKAEVVGIAAGASTPDWITKEVIGKVEEIEKNLNPTGEESREEEPQEEAVTPESECQAQDECCSQETEEGAEKTEDCCCPQETEEGAEKTEDGCCPQETEEGAEKTEVCCTEADVASVDVTSSEEEAKEEEKIEDEPSQAEIYEDSLRVLEVGEIVEGKVVSIDDSGVLVDVGYKSEGLIPAQEFSRKDSDEQLEIGDDVKVYVASIDSQEGTLKLSKRRADEEVAWEELQQAMDDEDILEAEVVQEVKGGLVVEVGLRGFVPASQVERGYVSDLSKYVGQNLRLRPIELDRQKNRAILSQRVVLEEEYEKLREETWATIEEGQVRSGVVKGITDFGVFVDLGGVDGLLHVSELSWGRVKHPSDVVKEGQPIDVMVLRVDRDKGKISLGLKQILDDPWVDAEEKYTVDSIVEGRVTRLAPFGAFVELEEGVEGLVHISEMANRHVAKPEEVVRTDDVVEVKVLRVRSQDRRISLSIKEAQPDQPVAEEHASTNMSSGESGGNLTIGDMFGALLEEGKERFASDEGEEEEQEVEEEEEEEKEEK